VLPRQGQAVEHRSRNLRVANLYKTKTETFTLHRILNTLCVCIIVFALVLHCMYTVSIFMGLTRPPTLSLKPLVYLSRYGVALEI